MQIDKLGEDLRSTDWQYLFNLNKQCTVLLLGSGPGLLPAALSESCGKVYVIDSSRNRISLLNDRINREGIENLYPIYTNDLLEPPLREGRFDLIAVRNIESPLGHKVAFRVFVRKLYNLLKEGGSLFLEVENRLAFNSLIGKKRTAPSMSIHTLNGYRKALKVEGFSDIHFFAALPYHEARPLFLAPIDSNNVMDFFYREAFPLFEMVSPETKRIYGSQYRLAKAVVRISMRLNITGVLKLFFSGFSIIAKR